jgi:hypothetical protein
MEQEKIFHCLVLLKEGWSTYSLSGPSSGKWPVVTPDVIVCVQLTHVLWQIETLRHALFPLVLFLGAAPRDILLGLPNVGPKARR